MNKKGQFDFPIAGFLVLVVGLLIFAPIILKIFTSVKIGVGTGLSNIGGVGGNVSANNFNTVMNSAISSWDKVIVMCFIFAIILLIISSILIDTSPFWIILYIVINFVLILFAPNIISACDSIYTNSVMNQGITNADMTIYLTMTNFIRLHFTSILVGVMIITGIIIYGKVFIFQGSGGRR